MGTTEQTAERAQVDAYLGDLEAMWAAFDELWGSFGPADWNKKYGKDWTFADQPFHMAYFDRVIVAEPMEAGTELPEEGRFTMLTMRQIDEWNAREFATRPADQTPARSLEELSEVRDRIRSSLRRLTDVDLGTYQVWGRLVGGGFTPLVVLLEAARLHNWGELVELEYRLKRTSPEPPRSATQAATGLYLTVMSVFCRLERATKPFTIGWDFTGPAGSSWTMRVADGACTLAPGRAEHPDLRLSMSPETFNIVMIRQARNPMRAMLRGEVKVKGFTKMGMLKKLFEPDPDKEMVIPGMG